MRNAGIKVKIVLSLLVVLALGGAGIAWMLQRNYTQSVESAATSAVASAEANFAAVQAGETSRLFALLDALTSDTEITATFANRDREGLAAITGPRFEKLKSGQGMTRWYFYLPLSEGTVFLRAYLGDDALNPEEYGDTSDRPTYLNAAKSQQRSSGFELGKSALALRAAVPYRIEGKDLGVMAVGTEIGGFLADVAAQTGDEYAMYLDKQYFDQEEWSAARRAAGKSDNWNDLDEAVLADATSDNERLMGFSGRVAAVPDGGTVFGEVTTANRIYVRGAFPVYDAGKKKVGAIVVLHDITESVEALRDSQRTVLTGVVALMVAMSIVILVLLNRLVFTRLAAMMSTVRELGVSLAGGDYDVVPPQQHSQDEIGSFEQFMWDFIALMATTLRSLDKRQ